MSRLVAVPACDHPVLSILIVLHRGGSLALDALASVRDSTDVDYEVIVVDNASPDASGALVRSAVRGITFVASPSNLGFGPAMNEAARRARGDFLCFLNPDVVVQDGWASPLVSTASRPGAAGATPLLVDPDGTVQEAGGAIDGLGHSHAVGVGEWELGGSAGARRVVDYASAAALVVRAAAFRQVGGFDPRYRLAYFEDADLAFALAEAGGCLWFEPRSRVVHLRGGTAVGRTALDLGHENHARFAAKWAEELRARPTDLSDPMTRLALRDRRVAHRVLLTDDSPATRGVVPELLALPGTVGISTIGAAFSDDVELVDPTWQARYGDRFRDHFDEVVESGVRRHRPAGR